jgi:site-specific DNA-methyltransferase (adenine-specific)
MLVNEDNLIYIKTLETDSIDFIYFDPPFAITEASYDTSLKWSELWPEMWRVLKPKGVIAIHTSQPFTFDLISTQRKHFKYCWYWKKNHKTGHLFSKHQPMRCIEEVCIFYKKNKYNPQMIKLEKPIEYNGRNVSTGNYYHRDKGMPPKTYTHNYPTHLLQYNSIKHPYSTRPIELCEYFIKTYSNENDVILDLTCSNATAGVACINLNRKYIGVDIDEKMINDAKERLKKIDT